MGIFRLRKILGRQNTPRGFPIAIWSAIMADFTGYHFHPVGWCGRGRVRNKPEWRESATADIERSLLSRSYLAYPILMGVIRVW